MSDVEERVKQKQKLKAKVEIVLFVSFALYAPLHIWRPLLSLPPPFWLRINMRSNITISFCP